MLGNNRFILFIVVTSIVLVIGGGFVISMIVSYGEEEPLTEETVDDIDLQGRGRNVLNYPLPKNDRRIIEQAIDDFVEEKIIDILWNDFYHYSTQFPSLDGFHTLGSTSASAIGLQMSSPGTGTGGLVFTQKFDVLPTSFKSPSRIRAILQVSTTTLQEGMVVVGNPTTDAYGFFILNDKLYGIAQTSDSASTTIEILTMSPNRWYLVEAKYEPNRQVEFSAVEDGDDVANQITVRGVIRTNLPTATNFNGLFVAEMEEKEALVKTLDVSIYEYMQKRFIQ